MGKALVEGSSSPAIVGVEFDSTQICGSNGCEGVAKVIHNQIGGDVYHIKLKPPYPELGPYRKSRTEWDEHFVVVKNGKCTIVSDQKVELLSNLRRRSGSMKTPSTLSFDVEKMRGSFVLVRERPEMMGLDDSFEQACVYLYGYCAAINNDVIRYFRLWLLECLGKKSNLSFPGIVRQLAAGKTLGHAGDDEKAARVYLFALLDQFLEEAQLSTEGVVRENLS